MRTQHFGKMPFSAPVQLYEIENKNGMILSVINYGARIVGLKVPSLSGKMVDVVCGFKTLEDYQKDEFYFGAIVGRVGGRIFPTSVMIGNRGYNLTNNHGDSQLHGGVNGFDKALWRVDPIEEKDGVEGVVMRHVSPAGTEGYPSEMLVEVEYRLTNSNELIIKIKATSEDTTIASIPNHAYFNLGGPAESSVNDHVISIAAESYLPVNEHIVPTGEIKSVKDTVYDFRKPRRLGDAIPTTPKDGFGYDDYFCLSTVPTTTPKHAANVYCPKTGINMEILTTQPGILMYTGNYLHKAVIGKYDEVLDRHAAVCLETQGYPNAVNTPAFPSVEIRPGMPYDHTTIWKFSKVKHKHNSITDQPKA